MVKAVSYMLTDAVYNFIYASGSTIRRKLDILASIVSIVKGLIEDDESLEKIQRDLEKLMSNYEPAVDFDFSSYAFEKANAMNSEIYDLFAEIMRLVTDYDLLELKVVQEVYARMWGDRR